MLDESYVEATTRDDQIVMVWNAPCGRCGEGLVKAFAEEVVKCHRCGEEWGKL